VYIGVIIDDPKVLGVKVFHRPAQAVVIATCITAVFQVVKHSHIGMLLFIQPLLQGDCGAVLRIIVDDYDMIERCTMSKYALSAADGLSSSFVIENKCDVHVLVPCCEDGVLSERVLQKAWRKPAVYIRAEH